MPRPNQRSNTLRKVFVKTPGGVTKVHYRKRKPSKIVCGGCGKQLSGVPNERPHKLRAMSKSSKRPERAYGGNLCPACTKRVLIEKARA